MAYQGNDAITKFQRRFSDTGLVASIGLLNEAATEIFSAIPYQRKQLTVNLTAGVFEYALGGGYAKVWSAQYVNSAAANDFNDLDPTSTDELDMDFPGWRLAPTAWPLGFYTSSAAALPTNPSGVVGLYPAPPTTTAAGYPIMQLDVSTIPVFSTGSELLPDIPFCLEAVADLMCFKRAKDVRLSDAMTWGQIAAQSIEQLAAIFWARNPRKPQEVKTTILQQKSWRGNKPGLSGWQPNEYRN